jgi:hypothetical protein
MPLLIEDSSKAADSMLILVKIQMLFFFSLPLSHAAASNQNHNSIPNLID